MISLEYHKISLPHMRHGILYLKFFLDLVWPYWSSEFVLLLREGVSLGRFQDTSGVNRCLVVRLKSIGSVSADEAFCARI